jgi:hypothetical protein
MALANPFISQTDGHVLADDMEKRRETFWGPSQQQPNPFQTGTNPQTGKPGYGLPLPGLRRAAR